MVIRDMKITSSVMSVLVVLSVVHGLMDMQDLILKRMKTTLKKHIMG